MADAFDALMKSIADEADAKVDYAAMHAAVLQKAAAMRRRRAQFVRYGAMAATLVVLAGVGTLFLRARGDAARSGENAAPQTVEFSMGDQAVDMAPEGAPEEPAPGCVPESVCPTEKRAMRGWRQAQEPPMPRGMKRVPREPAFQAMRRRNRSLQ